MKFSCYDVATAMKAVEVLKERGISEERVIFIDLVRPSAICRPPVASYSSAASLARAAIASPEGLKTFCTTYPSLRVVSLAFHPLPPSLLLAFLCSLSLSPYRLAKNHLLLAPDCLTDRRI